MKCLILFALIVAVTSSTPPMGIGHFWNQGGGVTKSVNINEDGTITITTPFGKKVVISKAVGAESKTIEISVEGPNMPTKKIHIDPMTGEKNIEVNPYWDDEADREKRSSKLGKKGKTQADLLGEIFQEYQGAVDEKSYGKLIDRVQSHVNAGEIDTSIVDALKYLHEKEQERKQGITTSYQQQTTRSPFELQQLLRYVQLQQQLTLQKMQQYKMEGKDAIVDYLERQLMWFQQQEKELQQQLGSTKSTWNWGTIGTGWQGQWQGQWQQPQQQSVYYKYPYGTSGAMQYYPYQKVWTGGSWY